MKSSNSRVFAFVPRITFVTFVVVFTFFFSTLLLSLRPHSEPLHVFAQTQEIAPLSLTSLIKKDAAYQGSTSAPVTLIDFSDLQCHLCNRFVKATEPQINSTYVQTGKVAFVFLHLPNRGSDSFPAALAAQCTNDQGKFWQYHNLLYENQGPIDSGWASRDNLKKFASQISSLDMQKFNSCFDSQKYNTLVDNDVVLAHSLGFTQTPSFVVVKNDGSNPQKVEGPQPYPEFRFFIDKELGGV
jgi:protein-disulfide isomerase